MIESTENKIVYTVQADGVFAFNLRFFEPGNIHCYLSENGVERELTRGTDFTVEQKQSYETGANITLLATAAAGAKLAIVRELPLIQETSLPEFGKLPSSSLERQLDKFAMMFQQLRESIARCFRVGPSADASPEELMTTLQTAAASAVASAGAAATAANAASGSAGAASNSAASAAAAAAAVGTRVSRTGDTMTGALTIATDNYPLKLHRASTPATAGRFGLGANTNTLTIEAYDNTEGGVRRTMLAINNEASANSRLLLTHWTTTGAKSERYVPTLPSVPYYDYDAVVRTKAVSGTNWGGHYRLYASGWIELFLDITSPAAALFSVTFPLPMADATYRAWASVEGTDGTSCRDLIEPNGKTATGMKLHYLPNGARAYLLVAGFVDPDVMTTWRE